MCRHISNCVGRPIGSSDVPAKKVQGIPKHLLVACCHLLFALLLFGGRGKWRKRSVNEAEAPPLLVAVVLLSFATDVRFVQSGTDDLVW